MSEADLLRFVAVLALASGCVQYDLSRTDAADAFVQSPAAKVDLLFMIDNSGSMAGYQAKLSPQLDGFLTYLNEGGTDYHIAVTTTDVDPKDGKGGTFFGSMVTSDTPHAAATFADDISVGTDGSPYECGLQGAYERSSVPKG